MPTIWREKNLFTLRNFERSVYARVCVRERESILLNFFFLNLGWLIFGEGVPFEAFMSLEFSDWRILYDNGTEEIFSASTRSTVDNLIRDVTGYQGWKSRLFRVGKKSFVSITNLVMSFLRDPGAKIVVGDPSSGISFVDHETEDLFLPGTNSNCVAKCLEWVRRREKDLPFEERSVTNAFEGDDFWWKKLFCSKEEMTFCKKGYDYYCCNDERIKRKRKRRGGGGGDTCKKMLLGCGQVHRTNHIVCKKVASTGIFSEEEKEGGGCGEMWDLGGSEFSGSDSEEEEEEDEEESTEKIFNCPIRHEKGFRKFRKKNGEVRQRVVPENRGITLSWLAWLFKNVPFYDPQDEKLYKLSQKPRRMNSEGNKSSIFVKGHQRIAKKRLRQSATFLSRSFANFSRKERRIVRESLQRQECHFAKE